MQKQYASWDDAYSVPSMHNNTLLPAKTERACVARRWKAPTFASTPRSNWEDRSPATVPFLGATNDFAVPAINPQPFVFPESERSDDIQERRKERKLNSEKRKRAMKRVLDRAFARGGIETLAPLLPGVVSEALLNSGTFAPAPPSPPPPPPPAPRKPRALPGDATLRRLWHDLCGMTDEERVLIVLVGAFIALSVFR